MALPESGTTWPPAIEAELGKDRDRWRAWWSGDLEKLVDAAGGLYGGMKGRRGFWQRRSADDATSGSPILHAPLAGEIAMVSADLVFGEFPDLQVVDPSGAAPDPMVEAAQDRLEVLIEKASLRSKLLTAAELAAGPSGGVLLRPMWNTELADVPLFTVIPGEYVHTQWRFGMLWSALIAEPVKWEEDGTIWWHLEQHGRGLIEHGLYHGNSVNLGERLPLTDHPATAGLQDAIVLPGRLSGELLVSYVPNALPNRRYPSLPIGRSDYAGAETFLDALDEAWSSLMRDIRMGQSRVAVDQSMTSVGGVGGQRRLDLDRELFVEMNLNEVDQKFQILQFAIRMADHMGVVQALVEQVTSGAGYSPQTFGLHIEGQAESGTALRMRENKTFRTQGRKQEHFKHPVEHSAEMLLAIDAEVFRRPTPIMEVSLTWPELQDDPVSRSTWIKQLGDAMAASIRTRVKLAQPELTGDELDREVAAVMAEAGISVPEPGSVGSTTETPAGPPLPAPTEPVPLEDELP